jgi:hypothetical protein
MRKIEIAMNRAILNNQNWCNGNTQVNYDEQNDVNEVYLFGNKIAVIGDTWLELFDAGYQTNTTKSRLNAILSEHGNSERVYQKNFDWFVSTKDGEVPFNGNIKLN